MNEDTAYWQFVGECGLDAKGNRLVPLEDYVFCLELGASYLRLMFGEPPGCSIRVLWFALPHTPGKFPAIGATFTNSDAEPAGYVDTLGKAIRIFNKAVDWPALSRESVRELSEPKVREKSTALYFPPRP